MPLLIDWRTASQPAEVVRTVVDALLQGSLVVLPTESGYVVAGRHGEARVVERLWQGSCGEPAALTQLISVPALVNGYDGVLTDHTERIVSRLWPGPLGLLAPIQERAELSPEYLARVTTGNLLRFRQPSQAVFEAIWYSGEVVSLIAREEEHSSETTETANALAERWGDAVAVAVDAGPIAGQPISWARAREADLVLENHGSVSPAEIVKAAAQWIVFVCTGNTCRSPMAEALLKARLAAKLACGLEELPGRGYHVFSAGVSASPGDGPSPEAVDVLLELGADLASHRSSPLEFAAVAHADHLVGMTRSHLLAVLTRYPVIGGSLRLLCGSEGDLDDPIGGDRSVYAQCARKILRHLDRFVQELVRR